MRVLRWCEEFASVRYNAGRTIKNGCYHAIPRQKPHLGDDILNFLFFVCMSVTYVKFVKLPDMVRYQDYT